jgi:hypothetical protein
MLHPCGQRTVPDGEAVDLPPLERLSDGFNDGVVSTTPTPPRGYLGGAIGYQLQVSRVRVWRPEREESRSVRHVRVRPSQRAVDVLRREIPTPPIVVGRIEAPIGVAHGRAGPRVGEGDVAGVGDDVPHGDRFDRTLPPRAIAVSVADRAEAAHERSEREVLHVLDLLELGVHVCDFNILSMNDTCGKSM